MSVDLALPVILQLGDPRLRVATEPVEDVGDPGFQREVQALTRALVDFQTSRGFGRAISAPQIGVAKRFLMVDLGDGPFLVANPEITWRSDARFTMWDDCMCFPSLLVRLERYESISLRYVNEKGEAREWNRLPRPESELVQHEIDHLDGILAIDHARGEGSIVIRTVFEDAPDRYLSQVDYCIAPPTPSNRPPPLAGA